MEELEKNKNANNSSLMVKKEELDTIENSMLNQNNVSTKKNNVNNNNNNNNFNMDNYNNINKINIELKNENEKLIEEIKKLKTKDENSKIAFIDSQKTWSNLALNIISYSFGLIDIYNNVANNVQNPQVEKIRQKLVKYQNFLKKKYGRIRKK